MWYSSQKIRKSRTLSFAASACRVRPRSDRQRDVVIFAHLAGVVDELKGAESPARRRLPAARSRRRSATVTGTPFLSRTATSTRTRSAPVRNTGLGGCWRVWPSGGRLPQGPESAAWAGGVCAEHCGPAAPARASCRTRRPRATNEARVSQQVPSNEARGSHHVTPAHADPQKTIDDRNGRRYRCRGRNETVLILTALAVGCGRTREHDELEQMPAGCANTRRAVPNAGLDRPEITRVAHDASGRRHSIGRSS